MALSDGVKAAMDAATSANLALVTAQGEVRREVGNLAIVHGEIDKWTKYLVNTTDNIGRCRKAEAEAERAFAEARERLSVAIEESSRDGSAVQTAATD
jgi:hypothetical protein